MMGPKGKYHERDPKCDQAVPYISYQFSLLFSMVNNFKVFYSLRLLISPPYLLSTQGSSSYLTEYTKTLCPHWAFCIHARLFLLSFQHTEGGFPTRV
jgi:hypothetical protein